MKRHSVSMEMQKARSLFRHALRICIHHLLRVACKSHQRQAALLRQLHAVITTGTAWDPAIAGGLKPQSPARAKGAAAA